MQIISILSKQKAVFGLSSCSVAVAVWTYHLGSSCPQLSYEGQTPHQGAHQHVNHDQTAPRQLPLGGATRATGALQEISRKWPHPPQHQAGSRHTSHYRFNMQKCLVLEKTEMKRFML